VISAINKIRMKKIILTYGLIAGAIVTVMFLVSIPLQYEGILDFDSGMFVGYTSMVIAFSMIFFGIKNYRDNFQNGTITFGKGFRIGIMITVIASLVYAVTWEVYYAVNGDKFNEHYTTCMLDKKKEAGITGAALEEEKVKLAQEIEMYQNPLIRFGMTLMEIFPVGLVITLITAGVLRKKEILPA
jgi:hypothetical protein